MIINLLLSIVAHDWKDRICVIREVRDMLTLQGIDELMKHLRFPLQA